MKKKYFQSIIIAIIVQTISGERIWSTEYEELNARNISEDVTEYWRNVSKQFLQISQDWGTSKYADWQKSKTRIVPGTISDQCLEIVDHILMNVIGDDQWTTKFVDSSGGIPSGILSMTQTSLGDFDQCLSIKDIFQNRTFVGKYCLATLALPRQSFFRRMPLNDSQLPVKWFGEFIHKWYDNDNYFYSAAGICFPSICTPNEIRTALSAHYPIINNFDFNVTFCQSTEEPSQPDSRIWIGIMIVAIPWCFIVLGTILDYFCCTKQQCSFILRFILGFSLISNIKFLFHIAGDSGNRNEEFQFVHGVRAFASIFIVVAHSAGFIYASQTMRVSPFARYPGDMIEMSKMIVAQPFYAGALMVLVFFVMSGMFLARGALVKGRLKINFVSYVGLRWLRYTPSLVGLIGLNYVAELGGSGPLFHHDLIWPTLRNCYENWIGNLLYISNYDNLNEICNVQIWYLSSEMQMHILAFVLILLYVRSSRLTYFVSFLMVIGGIVAVTIVGSTGFVTMQIVQAIMYPELPPPVMVARYVYFNPMMNMIAYFLGFLLGMFLLEKGRDRLSPMTVRIVWIFVILILVTSPFSNYFKAQDLMAAYKRNGFEAGLEMGLGVFMWSAAVAWTMWRFIVNPKNPAARLLSAKFWQPMSRLSFSLYLSHILVLWFNYFQIRNVISLGDRTQVFKTVSVALIEGYAVALFIYVTFEAPSVNFLRLIMPSKNKSKHPDNTESLRDMKLDRNSNLNDNLTE